MISNLNIEVSDLKILLHHEDKLIEFSLDFCKLQRVENFISKEENHLQKELVFKNIQVNILQNNKFAKIIDTPNQTNKDDRFDEILKEIENENTKREKIFTYLNEKPNSFDRLKIDFILGGKMELDSSLLGGDLNFDLSIASIKFLQNFSELFGGPPSDDLPIAIQEKKDNPESQKNKLEESNINSDFSIIYQKKDPKNKGEQKSFAFNLNIRRINLRLQVEEKKDQSVYATSKCVGISFHFSNDNKSNCLMNFSLEKFDLCKKLFSSTDLQFIEPLEQIELFKLEHKESVKKGKEMFIIETFPLMNGTGMDIKFSFEYNLELNIDLPFIESISKLFSSEKRTEIVQKKKEEPKKEENSKNFIIKFTCDKIFFNLKVPSIECIGNLSFKITEIVLILSLDPMRVYLNLTSFQIRDKEDFKVKMYQENPKEPQKFCLSFCSARWINRKSSVPDPNELNKLFKSSGKAESSKKGIGKLVECDIDHNGVAYIFGNDIEDFRLKTSDKIEEYKMESKFFVDISSPPVKAKISKKKLLELLEIPSKFSPSQKTEQEPSREQMEDKKVEVAPKMVVVFSSPIIEAKLIDDIHSIPYYFSINKLNSFSCLNYDKKDINFALLGYENISLHFLDEKERKVPLLSRISEQENQSSLLMRKSPCVINLGKWTSTHNKVEKDAKTFKITKKTKFDTHVIVKNISVAPSLFQWLKFLGFADPPEAPKIEEKQENEQIIPVSQWNLVFEKLSLVCKDTEGEKLDVPHSIITLDSLFLMDVHMYKNGLDVPIIMKNISLFVSKESNLPPLMYESFCSLLKMKKYAKIMEIPNLEVLFYKSPTITKAVVNFDPLSGKKEAYTLKMSTKSDTLKTVSDIFPGFIDKLTFLLTNDPTPKKTNEEELTIENKSIEELPSLPETNKKTKKIIKPQSVKIEFIPDKKNYSAGEEIRVKWDASQYQGKLSSYSFIGLAKCEYPDNKYYAQNPMDPYYFYTNKKRIGEEKFVIPNKLGKMEFRIYEKTTYLNDSVFVSRSKSFRIGLTVKLFVTRKRNKCYVTPQFFGNEKNSDWKPTLGKDYVIMYNSKTEVKVTSKPYDKETLTFEIPYPGHYHFKYESPGILGNWSCANSKVVVVDKVFEDKIVKANQTPNLVFNLLGLRLAWCMIEGKS